MLACRYRVISLLLIFLIRSPMTLCFAETADQWFARGYEFSQAKQYQQAIAAFDEAIRLNADHASAYQGRGLSYSILGDLKRAEADFSELIRLKPQHPVGYLLRSSILVERGKYQEALTDINQTIAFDSGATPAYTNRGTIYSRLKQYDKAVADFTRAIELKDYDLFKAYSNRGSCYVMLSQLDKAFADFAKAIEINPNYEAAYIQRAYVYMITNQTALALADYTKTIELNPQRPHSYLYRAEAYLKNGNLDLALADCNKAIQLAPSMHHTYWLLFQVYYSLGNQDNALRALAKFMNYAPLNDPRRAKAKELLQQVLIKEIDPEVSVDKNPSLPQSATAANSSAITGQERQAIRTSVQLMAAYNSKDLKQIREIDIRTRMIPDNHLLNVFSSSKDWTLRAVEVISYKDGIITARIIHSYEILNSNRIGKTINHSASIYRIANVEGKWRVIQVSDELGKDLMDTFKAAEKSYQRFGVNDLSKLEL